MSDTTWLCPNCAEIFSAKPKALICPMCVDVKLITVGEQDSVPAALSSSRRHQRQKKMRNRYLLAFAAMACAVMAVFFATMRLADPFSFSAAVLGAAGLGHSVAQVRQTPKISMMLIAKLVFFTLLTGYPFYIYVKFSLTLP